MFWYGQAPEAAERAEDPFTFSGFKDLVSVSWSGQSTQFDNIIITSNNGLDHFLCYKVKSAEGEPKFERRDLDLEDQFVVTVKVLVFNQFEDEVEGRILTIKKPRILCVPATKEDLGVVGDDDDKDRGRDDDDERDEDNEKDD